MAGHSIFPCCIFLIISHFFIESLPLISAQKPVFACDVGTTPTLSTFPFCDPSLDVQTRVSDLVNRMTLPEKIGNLGNAAAAVPRLGIPKYEWWSEALHGVSYTGPGVHFSTLIPGATSFPQVILTAASFNESLFETIGKVVSTEARAMYNVGLAGLTYWSPNVNILRDPRWGRAQEVPGEDPTLTSKYGAAYVRGLQQRDDGDEDRLKVASCCKHYTAYDVDNWHGVQRYTFNAVVTKQDMDDTFQPPFEKCISEGNVASVMCSYNKVNGIPTCGDPDLLAGIIRGQWNLNGYIVTDCDSLQVMFESQHYTKTPEETIALSLNSGLDLNCGGYLQRFTQSAIQKGLVNESVINRALTNNFATLMRLGFFDGDPTKQIYGNLGPEDVCTPGNQELAREAARQGIVLLKNTEGSLPLSPDSIKSLAVIGPNANASHTMLGNYEGTPCKYVTPLQGLTATVPTVFQAGCANVACAAADLDAAVKVAAVADAVVLVMGSDQSIEKESLDRTDVTLPGQQQLLISGVANVSKGPVILVIMSGGGWDIQFAKDNPKITSILWVGLPGEAGGAALSDIIFGLHNPSGRLPMTWYPQSYVVNVPMTNMNMRPDPATGYPGRTYRFYKGKTVYSFGDGLSYTPFEHTLVTAPPDAVSLFLEEGHFCHKSKCKSIDRAEKTCNNSGFSLKLKVKNKGKMRGSHAVLLFSSPPSVHNAAQKHLVGFEKVHLEAQGEGLVQFRVDVCEHLGLVDEAGNKKVAIGEHVLHIGDLKHSLTVRI